LCNTKTDLVSANGAHCSTPGRGFGYQVTVITVFAQRGFHSCQKTTLLRVGLNLCQHIAVTAVFASIDPARRVEHYRQTPKPEA
jgi:hypothetical protein